VRSFLVFLAVIVAIGLIWLTLPILNQRSRDHETRLVAALQLVEDAISGSSADILRVDLFSPEIAPLAGDGRWQVTGIVSTQDRAGKSVNVRYTAVVAFTCQPFADPACGKITTLTIEDQPLVVEGAVVAELQDVLRVLSDAAAAAGMGDAATTAPSDAGGSAALPSPNLDTAIPPATEPESTQSSMPAVTEIPAPVPTSAPESSAAPDAVPIQGDRLIFLTQKRLKEIGYDPGPVDGRVGPRTTTAIQDYQQRAGLAIDGQPSAALLEHMSHAVPVAAQ
jgi:Putative peptidoglycan binding domain